MKTGWHDPHATAPVKNVPPPPPPPEPEPPRPPFEPHTVTMDIPPEPDFGTIAVGRTGTAYQRRENWSSHPGTWFPAAAIDPETDRRSWEWPLLVAYEQPLRIIDDGRRAVTS